MKLINFPNNVFDQIKNLSNVIRLRHTDCKIKLTNLIITLHSNVTFIILMVGMFFVSLKQYFGEPITCLMSSKSDISSELLHQFCWMEGSYSLTSDVSALPYAYPGVRANLIYEGTMRRHKYYQWVYFVIFIQAILFYLPKYIWRQIEASRLENLIKEICSKPIQEFSDYTRIRLLQELADNLMISNIYYRPLIFCQLFSFVHVIFEIWFTDIFLGGRFLRLGIDWLNYASGKYPELPDPLAELFPRMVKCSFRKFGYSGAIEIHDSLCFVPLNIVHEKLYVFLWFWFMILTVATAFFFVKEVLTHLLPCFRLRHFKALAPTINQEFINKICNESSKSYVLSLIASHMNPSYFRDVMESLKEKHFDKDYKPINRCVFGEEIALKTITSDQTKKKDCKMLNQKSAHKNYYHSSVESFHKSTNNSSVFNVNSDESSIHLNSFCSNNNYNYDFEWSNDDDK